MSKSVGDAGSEQSPDVDELADGTAWSRVSRVASIITVVCLVGVFAEVGIWAYRRASPPDHEHDHGALSTGTLFPTVDASELDGQQAPFRPAKPDRRATLLFLLTSTCSYCQANVPTWNDMYATAGGEVLVVGLSLDDKEHTRKFVAALGVEFPVRIVDDPQALIRSLRLRGVPQTIVLDSGGEVIDSIIGPLTQEMRDRLVESVATVSQQLPDGSAKAGSTVGGSAIP